MTTNAKRRREQRAPRIVAWHGDQPVGLRRLGGYTAPSSTNADRRPKYRHLRRWANEQKAAS